MRQDRLHVPGSGIATRPGWAATSPRPCPRRWPSTRPAARPPGWTSAGLLPRSGRGPAATELQQPALVTTSLAIEEAIRSRGIVPDFVVGHSVGEFAALSAAETLSVKDAIALVRERGLAMAEAASSARLDGRDPRACRRGRRGRSATRSRTSGRRTTTARARSSISGADDAVDEVHRGGEPGSPARDQAEGVGCVPLAARRARRRQAEAGGRQDPLRRRGRRSCRR